MTLISALLLGVLIGLSLGALGGGGSILTVPALVYVLGESAHAATTSSLVIVGITAAVGAMGHARAGRVRWSAGTTFGLVGIAASFGGTYLNRMVAPNVLLLAFSALMLVAAFGMLHRAAASAPLRELVVVGGGSVPEVITSSMAGGGVVPHSRHTPRLVIAGLGVGFLTGFLGVGGGFVIVPALTIGLGYAMQEAVGTSLLVIAINSAAALAARAGHETFHWAVIIPFALTAMLGSLAGKRVTDRVPSRSLTIAFASLTILVAVYVALRSALGG